jgi:hypothetical protein
MAGEEVSKQKEKKLHHESEVVNFVSGEIGFERRFEGDVGKEGYNGDDKKKRKERLRGVKERVYRKMDCGEL